LCSPYSNNGHSFRPYPTHNRTKQMSKGCTFFVFIIKGPM
jgi:hypothetical protein